MRIAIFLILSQQRENRKYKTDIEKEGGESFVG